MGHRYCGILHYVFAMICTSTVFYKICETRFVVMPPCISENWSLKPALSLKTMTSFPRSCVVVKMYSPLRRRFVLDFGKQTAAWRRLQWPDCSANEMKWNKDILAWIRRLICGCLAISSWGFFASRMGHPELDCEALSFLLQWKLGVKGNRLNRNGSEK